MYIHGSFINQQGDTVTVYIVTKNDRADTIEIGVRGSGMFFTDDPVETTSEMNDTFDHLLRQSASIRLLCAEYMADFFCPSCRDAVVNIYKGGRCVFAGFIEPQTYSQAYNEAYDEIELNCVDALSALQYSKYKDIGSLGVLYDTVKDTATQRTFKDIITEILDSVTKNIDIVGGTTPHCLYDGSRATAKDAEGDIFAGLSISELLFLGDEEDDVWQQDEVLEEMLRYLNLHITQDGLTFYVFAWETVNGDDTITWQDITDSSSEVTQRTTTDITTAIVTDCDTQISIGEVYNQLLLTCDIKSLDNVVESPLDSSSLTSPYLSEQRYCSELSVGVKDAIDLEAFSSLLTLAKTGKSTNDRAKRSDWYVRVRSHQSWRFPDAATGKDLVEEKCLTDYDQDQLPTWLASNLGAAILSMGKNDVSIDSKDNSPTSKPSMTNYLVVSVNGNGDDTEQGARPSPDELSAATPVAEYTGANAGVFSPTDESITNYIVITGTVRLNPVISMSFSHARAYNAQSSGSLSLADATAIKPSRDNDKGRFYTRAYFHRTPTSPGFTDLSTPFPFDDGDTSLFYDSSSQNFSKILDVNGLTPPSDDCPQSYEFKYSAVGDGSDKVSKVAALACQLIIGDKCVVEKENTEGKPSDYEWRAYKTREQCDDDDEYYQQSFTIGFDPQIGDKLIGTDFDIQDNSDYVRLRLDADGTAIPIHKADRVSGRVTFRILGPVNSLWNDVTRRHRTWFRRPKWYENSVPLLSHVSSIVLKDFEVKVLSDTDTSDGRDNDVVYMSDTHETFINRKDDIEFKISSALTIEECRHLGVKAGVNLSTPANAVTGDGVHDIYDCIRGTQAKPEQMYVDSYYTEYHKPRIIMEQSLADTGSTVSLFGHYRHPAIEKTFYVMGISRNLINGSARIKLKETWQ